MRYLSSRPDCASILSPISQFAPRLGGVKQNLSVFLFAGLVAATPASAQLRPETQTGSLVAARPQAADPERAALVRKSVARCVYHAATPKVLALLEHSGIESVDAEGAGIKDFVRDLKLDTCLSDEVGFDENALGMQISQPTLRDLLAEEAYLAKNRAAPQVPATANPLSIQPASAAKQNASALGITAFSDCTVRRNTRGADALLRTPPSSVAERQAAMALAPDMGACLVAGQKLSLKSANVRALMAYAMWSRFGR